MRMGNWGNLWQQATWAARDVWSMFGSAKPERPAPRTIDCMELEDRILLSASPVGTEALANSNAGQNQVTQAESPQAVATDASGNYVVVWTSFNQNGDGPAESSIFAQRFNSAGVAQGSEFQVNTAAGTQDRASVAMNSNGDFVITWTSGGDQDGSGAGIFARKYNSAGVAQGGEFQVNTYTTGDQIDSVVAIDSAGNMIFAWESAAQDGQGYGVYGQVFTWAGGTIGGEFQINTLITNDQRFISVAVNENNQAVFVWTTDYPSNAGLRAKLFDPLTSTLSGELSVNTTSANNQQFSGLDIDAAGNFVIAWASDQQDGSSYGIYAQRFNATGAKVGGEFHVSTTTADTQTYARVGMDADGDFVVIWSSANQDDGASWGIYGQKYDATGATVGGEFLVNTTTAGNQEFPSVAMDAAGNFIVAWSGPGSGDSQGVYVQRYLIPNIAPVNTVPGAQSTNEDTALVFSSGNSNALSVSDADAGDYPLQITLSVSHGTLGLSGVAGLSFTSGNGHGSATMTFTGTASAINAALNGLRYTPTLNYSGADTLQILTSDQGYLGSGGALTDIDSVAITINAVNDAPVAVNQGLLFDGVDDKVVVSSSATLQVTTAITIEAWVQPQGTPSGTQVILNKEGEYELGITSTGQIQWAFANTSPGWNWVNTGYVLPAGQWAHVAVSYNAGVVNTYVNGALVHTLSGSGAIGDAYPVLNELTIGGRQNASTQRFQGLIDDVRVWNVERTGAEISANYDQSLTGSETGLVGYWQFAEATGTTALDSTANGNNGVLGGGVAGNEPTRLFSYSLAEDGSLSISAPGVLADASDAEGTPRTAVLVSGPAHAASFTLNADGSFSYTPVENYYGSDSFVFQASDGSLFSQEATVALTVTAVNDAPVNATPSPQSMNEDATLVFSSGNGNQISIGDLDAGGSSVQVTLTATNGTISLNGTSGLTLLSGTGTGDASVQVQGTIANINAALNGLSFSPTSHFNGAASIAIETSDLGNAGSGGTLTDSDTINITVNAVNDAPVNTVPGAQSTNEDTALVFSAAGGNAITISDVDAGSSPLQVTLTVTNGTITLSGIAGLSFTTGTGTADTSMVFTGTVANINAALNGLTYQPTANYNGGATLQIVTSDQGNTGSGGTLSDTDTVNITVSAVNDAPVNTLPVEQSTNRNVALVLSSANGNQISISDVDAASASVRLTLAATNGTVTLNGTSGLSFSAGDGTNDATMTFTGTLANINAALDGLTYNPTTNYVGAATLQITTEDLGNTGSGGPATTSDTLQIEMAVEFRVNTTTSGYQLDPVTAISATSEFVVVWRSDGQDGGGRGVYGQRYDANGATVGSEFRVNTTTSGDQDEPAVAMDDTGNFVVVWTSNGQDGSGNGIYAQRYNSAGVAQGGEFRINATTSGNQQFAQVAMDADGDFVVVWESDQGTATDIYARRYNAAGVAQGSEFLVNTTTAGNQDQAAIGIDAAGNFIIAWTTTGQDGDGRGVFAQRFNAAGATQGSEFQVNNTGTGHQDEPAIGVNDSGAFVIAWTSNNSQDGDNEGVFARRYNSAGVAQGGEFQVNTYSNSDQDDATVGVDASGSFVIAWESNGQDGSGNGVYAQRFTAAGAASGAEFRVSSTTSNSQNDPALAVNGAGDLIVVWEGHGVGDSDGVFGQYYPSANDAPVNSVPGAQTTAEDTTLIFSTAGGNAITVSDVDAGAGQERVTLTATNGTLTLATTTGLSFTTGDGVGDTTMVFTGTLANLNAALNGLAFSPTSNYNGAASIQITTNDLGNHGTGGALSDTDTVSITVTAVNDAPANTVPGAQSMNEDATLVFSAAGGNAISISDLDAGVAAIRVTMSATNGTLTLNGTAGLTLLSGTGTGDASVQVEGTIANINAALNGLSFSPTSNYNGAASITILSSDLGNTGTGGTLTDSDTINITVNAVNDAPANSIPGAQSTNEDTPLVFSSAGGNAISVNDIDAGSSSLQVTLIVTNGTISLSGITGLSFTTGTGTADTTMVFTGTQANINGALNGLAYQPTANYNGAATLQIVTSDQGNTGSGGALTDTDTVNITVNAVNDAPANTTPGAQSTNEDTVLVFSSAGGNAISVSDLDAGSSSLQVTLTVTNGTISLSGATGLSFTTGTGTADATMVFTGSQANINAALNGLTYQPTGNYNGAATLQIVTSDQGNTGSGGTLTDTDTVNITVNAVNDAPVNTVPGAQSTNEDTALVFSSAGGNAISVNDLDAGSSPLQISLTVTNGTISLSGTTGLSFTTGTGSADATMVFTGTQANINAALNGLTYQPTGNYNGGATLQIVTSDQGNTGSGGALSDTDAINITVNAVNDVPANSVPGAQSTNEDTALVFSSAGGNTITVADLDAGSSPLQVTLTVTNGTISLSGITGLSFTTGTGTADTTIVFTGSQANINAALNGLTYQPTANYNGGATLQIVTSDQGNTGSGGALTDTDTVNITVAAVNDAPVNTVPGAQSTNEDTPLVFSSAGGNAISVSDLDADSSPLQVTLTVTNGSVSLSGITGLSFTTGTGTLDATMVFTGSQANINAALNGLTYQPTGNYNGAATLQIVTSDQGNTGSGGTLSDTDTVNITVAAVNDAPVNTVPGVQSTSEDTALVFSSAGGNAISVSDLDAGSSSLQVTLTVTNGTISLSGSTGLSFTTGTGTADTTMVFTGSQASINAALDGLTYQPTANYNGGATLQIVTSDQGNTGSGGTLTDTDTVNITVNAVNDAPVNSVPGAQSTNEDTALVFSSAGGNAISVADLDAGTNPVQVTVSVANGSLTLNGLAGLTFTSGDGIGDATMTFTGTIANVNAALNGMSYLATANYNGPDTLQIVTSDQGNSGAGGVLTDTSTVNITVAAVNDAPVNSVPGPQTVSEDSPLVFAGASGNAIVVSDLDAGAGALQVTLTVTNGALTLGGTTGLAFTTGDGAGDATMTFSGSLADLNAALDGLRFDPSVNYNGPATLQITTSDLGNSGSGGAQTAVSSVAINVTAVNDAPAISVPAAQTTNEDWPLTFSSAGANAISVSDIDAASGQLQVTVSVTSGTLSLSGTSGLTFSTGSGSGDATMVFTGTVANINAALNGLTYAPTANYNGADTLQIAVSDQGNTGAGGALGDAHSVSITVDAVNDAPVNTVPAAQSVAEDSTLIFSAANGNVINVGDLDAGAGILQVTLSVTDGLLSLGSTSGLTFLTGDGVSDATIVFTGDLAQLNAALEGLQFAPTANYNGPATLQITTSDLGNTGAGGPLTANSTVAITVSAVNDAPINTVPGPQTTSEDTPLLFSTATGNAISIGDLDAATGSLQITLSVTNGGLTLNGTSGLTFITGSGAGDATMVFTGTLADINAVLDGMSFTPTPDYNGGATLQIVTSDLGNSGAGGALSDSSSVSINITAVNDAPTLTLPPTQTIFEDNPLVFSAAGGNSITVGDVDAAAGELQISLSITSGSLTLGTTSGLTFTQGTGTGDTAMVFTGTLTDVNAALDGLTYSPALDFNGTATLNITADDQGNTGAGGPLATTGAVDVDVTAVNDGPTTDNPGPEQVDTFGLVFSAANGNLIVISDIDAGTGDIEVTITATEGTVTLSGTAGLTFSTGDGDQDGIMVFTGQVAAVNAALDGMLFQPSAAEALLQINATDLGNTGAGPAMISSMTVEITQVPLTPPPSNPTDPLPESTNDNKIEIKATYTPPAEEPLPSGGNSETVDKRDVRSRAQLVGIAKAGEQPNVNLVNQKLDSLGELGDPNLMNQIVHRGSTGPAAAKKSFGVIDTSLLWNELDELGRKIADEGTSETLVIGAVSGATVLMSAGYLVWCLRGGALVASALSAIPAWRSFDPLPVLEFWERESKREDDEDAVADEDVESSDDKLEVLMA